MHIFSGYQKNKHVPAFPKENYLNEQRTKTYINQHVERKTFYSKHVQEETKPQDKQCFVFFLTRLNICENKKEQRNHRTQ